MLPLAALPWGFILRLGGPLLLAGGLYVAGYSAGSAKVARAWNAERAAQTEANLEAERMVRLAEQRRASAAKEAADALQARSKAATVAADAARDELDRLRGDIAAAQNVTASDPDAARRAAAAAGAWDVFGECATALRALAKTADDLEGRLIGWQEWYRAARTQ